MRDLDEAALPVQAHPPPLLDAPEGLEGGARGGMRRLLYLLLDLLQSADQPHGLLFQLVDVLLDFNCPFFGELHLGGCQLLGRLPLVGGRLPLSDILAAEGHQLLQPFLDRLQLGLDRLGAAGLALLAVDELPDARGDRVRALGQRPLQRRGPLLGLLAGLLQAVAQMLQSALDSRGGLPLLLREEVSGLGALLQPRVHALELRLHSRDLLLQSVPPVVVRRVALVLLIHVLRPHISGLARVPGPRGYHVGHGQHGVPHVRDAALDWAQLLRDQALDPDGGARRLPSRPPPTLW
mmetsp:Transcript_91952/g.297456  ORF Transcript_91952/g.297456 Transcript_91952/m.297456 type:complete len:294 (+) Transcript_91952:439-1320(+)